MKHIKPNYYKLFYILILISAITFSFNTSSAANISDLQSQQSELSKQIEEGRSKVKETNSQISSIEDEISIIDNDIYAAEEKIYQTENDIEGKKNEIVNTEETIKQKQIELDNEKENQAETIRTVYESYKYTNPLRMIIGSSTLTQLLNYNAYLEALNDKIDASIAEVNKIKKELEDKKTALEEEERSLVALEEQQRAYKRGLDEQKGAKDNLLATKESEKASLESQIEEFKATQAEVQAQIAAAVAASRQSSGISAKDKGVSSVGFMWPTSGDITATFMDPEYFSYFGFNHYGIDLANTSGTPIYATAGGTITTATVFGGYGNCIIIGHNARYSSLYGHMMYFAVGVGDEVKAGDVIGYMGSTGFSTGPHLHFEIWEYGERMNPMGYLP